MRRIKSILLVTLMPFVFGGLLAACSMGIGGPSTAERISDNNRAVSEHRINADLDKAGIKAQTAVDKANINASIQADRNASREAVAQIRADSQVNRAAERTQQTLLVQNATSERLLIQSQHLLAVREAGTQRTTIFLITAVVLAILGGACFLLVYMWNNPRQQQPIILPQVEPVPRSLMRDDARFAQAGWRITGPTTAHRVIDGAVVAECKLLEG